jgi:hypothetical protein
MRRATRRTRRLALLLAIAFGAAATAQEKPAAPKSAEPRVTVEPSVVHLPPDHPPISRWPEFVDEAALGRFTFTVTVRIAAGGIAPGGALRVGFGYPGDDAASPIFRSADGYLLGPSHALRLFPLATFQVNRPRRGDHVTASASRKGSRLELVPVAIGEQDAQLVEAQVKSKLEEGDVVTFTFGDRGSGRPGASLPWHPGSPRVVVFEDRDGSGRFTALPDPPTLLFTGAEVDDLHVTIPMTPRRGEPFRFSVQAFQGDEESASSNVIEVEDAQGVVEFRSDDPQALLPPPANFRPADRGVLQATATFRSAGVHWIEAILHRQGAAAGGAAEKTNELAARSNPAWVDPPFTWQLLAGDLHRHCAEGGHAGLTAALCWPQLWNRRDDFGAVLAHVAHNCASFRSTNEVARRFQQRADPDEREFVAFPAIEWTAVTGHRHLVWRDFTSEAAPTDKEYRGADAPAPVLVDSQQALFDFLRRRPAGSTPVLAIAHHPLWRTERGESGRYFWAPQPVEPLAPLVEIYSVHGSSERRLPEGSQDPYLIHHSVESQRPAEEKAAVDDGLAQGFVFGLIGGSDNHAYGLYQVHSDSDGVITCARRGLAIVLGERGEASLRRRVFSGLQARRAYATTGARTLLSFETRGGAGADGGAAPMGSLVTAAAPVAFRIVAVAATTRRGGGLGTFVRRVVVRDGSDVDDVKLAPAAQLDAAWSDPAPLPDGRPHAYYVRLVQDDGNVAWSSPIFWTLR